MTKEIIKKELSKYSKEDIIKCLCEFAPYFHSYPLDTMFSRLKSQKFLNDLEEQQKEHDNASAEFDESLINLNTWKYQVIEKYGHNGKVRLGDIPDDEIKIGAKPEEEFNNKKQTYLKVIDKEIKQ